MVWSSGSWEPSKKACRASEAYVITQGRQRKEEDGKQLTENLSSITKHVCGCSIPCPAWDTLMCCWDVMQPTNSNPPPPLPPNGCTKTLLDSVKLQSHHRSPQHGLRQRVERTVDEVSGAFVISQGRQSKEKDWKKPILWQNANEKFMTGYMFSHIPDRKWEV